jgi:pimeloyl-ACP methyl ester carboxylesterase
VARSAEPAADPEVVSLATKDGVQLTLTYYPSAVPKGSPEAKQVTPVVLLHDYKDSRAVFALLAQRLRHAGESEDEKRPSFAAVAVDLRGHGDSTRQQLPNGFQLELDASKINPAGLAAMVTQDLEEVRRWLVGKNDEAALNLNKLCVVGAGMGANVAANWAAQDWVTPSLATVKQGQDVKAAVLISPRQSYRGLTMHAPLQVVLIKRNVVWQLFYGAEDPEFRADARRIQEQLERFHPAVAPRTGPQVGNSQGTLSGLVVVDLPTSLQGGNLLSQFGAQIEAQIVSFLTAHVAQKEVPWFLRRNQSP